MSLLPTEDVTVANRNDD